MVTKILITFAEDVEVSEANLRLLDRAAARICDEYSKAKPDRIMWPFGHGAMMTANPLMLSDDEPIPFDESTYHIECAERERHGDEGTFKLRHTSHPAEEMFHDIADFHRKFALEYRGPPRGMPFELEAFRTMFMAEELAEYVTDDKDMQRDIIMAVQRALNHANNSASSYRPSLEKQFDALIDLCYVAMGTAYLHGFAFDEGWRRVHDCNMKKVRATDASHSARGSVHDVVKPPGWTAPDLSDLVKP